MSYPAPSRDHHQQFCNTEMWMLVRDGRGRAVAHHVTYELLLFDERILRTRISRPVDRTTYGKSMWAVILRDQLEVDARAFWACALDGTLPDRGAPTTPRGALPLALVKTLIGTLGLSESEAGKLSKAEALALLEAHWSK